MSPRDYTRWNRAGQRRIDYVDGNAARFLEDLRLALCARFPSSDPAARSTWARFLADGVGRGSSSEQLGKIVERYESAPDDIGWELARSFARACHVLAGHIDAYANERTIETATQWESLRRLVAMLDYAPTPPASASTPIVLFTKAVGRVEVGALQVSHAPPKGDAIVFENLEAIDVDPELDAMRIGGARRSAAFADIRAMRWILPEEAEATIGDLLVLEQSATGQGFATTVDWIEHDRLSPAAAPREPWPVAETRLHLAPKAARKPLPFGERWICVAAGHGFVVGDVVAWREGSGWKLALVQARDNTRLRLSVQALPAVGAELFLAKAIADGEQARLPLDVLCVGWVTPSGQIEVRAPEQILTLVEPSAKIAANPDDPGGQQVVVDPPPAKFKRLASTHTGTINVVLGVDRAKTRVLPPPPPGWLIFEGTATGWQTGAWFVGEGQDRREALRLLELVELEQGFRARFEAATSWIPDRVHGPFKQQLRPQGWDFDERVVSGAKLILDRPTSPALAGRRVLLRAGDGPSHVATVVRRVGAVIEIDPPLPAALGLRAGDLEIHGNVALFGHGERKPAQVLGSGDATRSNQRFILAVAGVSFVADPGSAAGVRADIELLVDGRRWRQVDALRESAPTDEHYAVRMTEAGELTIETGDGINGRRLPSGSNNLRIALRVGSGLQGNVAAASFKRLGKPHRLIERLLQPRPATGGNDMAGADELRERAPGTVLALGRAVALEDFALLANSHASVWQAHARQLPVAGALERVEVIVVPAGGGELGEAAQILRDYLLARTLPDVDVVIRGYRGRRFALLVRVAVDEARYEVEPVLASVRAALEARFSLDRRRLGQALEIAEVIQVVETRVGVLHSGVILNDDPALERLPAAIDEVLYLAPEALELIATREIVRVVDSQEQRRAIEQRPASFIQGVGTGTTDEHGVYHPAAYERALHDALGVATIRALAAVEPSTALAERSGIPGRILREIVIKARIVCEARFDETRIAELGARSLGELLRLDVGALAERHQLEVDAVLALREQLRLLQLCLDEPAMAQIRLAEFSLIPELAQWLPAQASPRTRPVAFLPATIIAGIGRKTAELLAQAPSNCLTVADVAYLRPERVAARSSRLHPANIWEVQRKAKMLLDFEVPAALWPFAAQPLEALLTLDRPGLAALTGAAGPDLDALIQRLLELELILERPPIPVLDLDLPRFRGHTIERLSLVDLFGADLSREDP